MGLRRLRKRLPRHTGRHPGRRGLLTFLLLALTLPALTGCGSGSTGEPSAGSRTLDAPPDLQIGEWWTLEIDAGIAGASYRTTTVVTAREGARAAIGMAAEDFDHDYLLIHLPPLGDLQLETFAWRVMWDDFEALRFPLEPGRTWSADFHGFEVEAEVTRVEGGTAHVVMAGPDERIELTYDAEAGMITEFREETLGLAFRVTGHGFDYEGAVLTPTGIELAGMDSYPSGPQGDPVPERDRAAASVDVERRASHGSVGFVLLGGNPGAAEGTYRITATAPDGARFEEILTLEPGGPLLSVATFGHDAVTGPWRLEYEHSGTGLLAVELFVYDLEEIRLGGP